LAAIFLPATMLTGIFGMNPIFREESLNIYDWTTQLSIIAIATIISIILLRHKRK
jgi:Mg2+ and Co2+ transporter CorA